MTTSGAGRNVCPALFVASEKVSGTFISFAKTVPDTLSLSRSVLSIQINVIQDFFLGHSDFSGGRVLVPRGRQSERKEEKKRLGEGSLSPISPPA
jgi:hypothetical protein